MITSDADLARLELLREFKRKMPRTDPAANVGPFDDCVSTAKNGSTAADLSDIHVGVRTHVRDIIGDVRDGRKQSQVVLLSGAAGVGKTHLLRSFATSESMTELGHVFVGGSNHWTIGEFQAQLLDWVIEALTQPSPEENHPLLQRIRAIGFRAVEHLLTSPVTWKTCLLRPRGPLRRLFRRLTRPTHATLKALTIARDPMLFGYFDDAAFGAYVCDRFLLDRANLNHRFALRVLLTYLFPDRAETGIGTRERVLHWFRGRADDDYFTRRLGATERPDRSYSRFDAVKLLAHLFSPAVSEKLSIDAFPCPPRVLLLTFDQAEGRDELFDSDKDWNDFFAHLSELYNSLPNVVVLFTMTLALRNRLHGQMERQFQDRIQMDDKLTLALPTAEQITALYRARLDYWLCDEPIVRSLYRKFSNPLLPFEQGELSAIGQFGSVREVLKNLDKAFHKKLSEIVVDADLDYLYDRRERKSAEAADNEWDYTADHIDTVHTLLRDLGSFLGQEAGVELKDFTPVKVDSVPALRLVFNLPNQPQKIIVHLARLGYNYTSQITALINSVLYDRDKNKNFLKIVRPTALPVSWEIESRYSSQFATGICPTAVESTCLSLLAVNAKRDEYKERGQEAELDRLIRDELAGTYLHDLFRHARGKLDELVGGAAS